MTSQSRPQAALEEFLTELHSVYENWYDRQTRKAYRRYMVLQAVALLSGFLSAVIAAVADAQTFVPWGKTLLIVLPLLGSLAGTILLQSRTYDTWQLREEGRFQFQGLVGSGRLRAAAATSDEEFSKIHEELHRRAQEIEEKQSLSFFGLYPSNYVASFGKPPQKGHNSERPSQPSAAPPRDGE